MCEYYRPYYRQLIIEGDEDVWPLEDQILVAEFCMSKRDYIVGSIDCHRCKVHKVEESNNQMKLPLAG